MFGISHDGDAPAVREHFVALGDSFHGVISSLGVNVGPNFVDEAADIGLREDHYSVYVGEGGDDFSALFGGNQRTPLALQGTHRLIRVHRHD